MASRPISMNYSTTALRQTTVESRPPLRGIVAHSAMPACCRWLGCYVASRKKMGRPKGRLPTTGWIRSSSAGVLVSLSTEPVRP